MFLIVISLTAGRVLLMWMGELITQRGIGNGISLMIFASIVSRLPQRRAGVVDELRPGLQGHACRSSRSRVIAAIVFVQEGQRRIPIQYAKRVIGRRMTQGGQTYLPLRVNMAGVIPVIFAASIMAFPPTVGQLINSQFGTGLLGLLQPDGWRRTSSASRSSSSSSRTSTRRSRSTPSTRPTTSRSTAASSRA